MTAIITDAHYRMSVALIRDLADANVRVIACESDQYANPVGFACRGVSCLEKLPQADYENALYALCRKVSEQEGQKPALLPVGAKTLALISAKRARFDEVCALCIPTAEQLDLFNNKQALHALAQELSIRVPCNYVRGEESSEAFFSRVPLPCVVKPQCGEKFGLPAQKRYCIANTVEELASSYTKFAEITGNDPIVQEYLAGGGCGCSVLAKDGKVLCSISHRRVREYPISGGPSSCCETMENPYLLEVCEKLVAHTNYTGLAMFEFKYDAHGNPYLLEVNPRIWGTYPLTRVSKSNFSVLWLYAALALPLPAYQPPQAVRMVYYPTDFAAALGYLRAGKSAKCFDALADLLRANVKNALYESSDPAPWYSYLKSLLARGCRS